ncbi:MAG TPA: cell surface protein SprA [Chitinophagaceae bacterium]
MNLRTAHILRTLVGIAMLTSFLQATHAQQNPGDSLRYPLTDRRGDPYTYPNRNTLDFKDTSYLKRNIIYDPKTKEYYVEEKIGTQWYRTPVSISKEDFLRMQGRKDEELYFKKRADMLANMNRRLTRPKFKVSPDWFNRIVGTGKIDIRPSGYVDILAGYQGQNIKNPTLPERARKNGGLDFNMNSQLQVDANIGDKLKLPINYNTLANFDFENQLKLDYQGKDDEILKQFQAGTVNFTTKSTLIPGLQALFGLKTQVQFGKLFITGVLANQRSQRQSLGLQGGAAAQRFSVKADEYDENRHFLLAQYFHDNYNNAMRQLPIVNSSIQILKVEVWVTNRNGTTTDTRDIVAFMDLGETNPFNVPTNGNTDPKPFNKANALYDNLLANPATRNSSQVTGVLTGPAFNLSPVQDFEKTFARKLLPTDYYFNPQIGFLSLNQPLQPDEILGVAFQYTYNGRVYQVGEFSQDVPPDTTGALQRVLFLKLLKATSQRTNLPIWDLMMKNVYSVGFGQLERQDFTLDVLYEEPSLGEKTYLPPNDVLDPYKGQPLITLLNLDRLNNQLDPQPDGKFDFIEGFTVISSQSRIIFPTLEPFGHDLDFVYPTPELREKYLYYPLYDTIKAIAQTFANLNRFELNGRSKTSGATGEYQLGYNIPRGSVTVYAGGQTLIENVDYEINYDLGTLRVINQAVISSGIPVNIQFENQAAYGLQQKTFWGVRIDYLASKKLTLGGTIARLSERPFFVKQSYGEDPVRNTMYGVDVDYRNDIPRLTKWLDKLPFYSTRTMSSITAFGEAAILDPGHAKQIGKGNEGVIYIDDFEGTRSGVDLRFPLINWTLASIPQGNGLFPEASLTNDLASGFNRSKIAWYNIEPVLQEKNNSNNPLQGNVVELSKPEVRQVLQQEIFPKRSLDFGQGVLTTFDIAFYPKDKGPYNYETRNTRIGPDGRFINPKQSWGGLMRNIDQIDFETSNIEYIEFWMQDPFVQNNANPTGGKLYFNLGNISEDVLKDGKRFYENGLPTPTIPTQVDSTTVWGKVPSNPLQVTNAFSNNIDDRQYQDVGFDGLRDEEELRKYSSYLAALQATAPAAFPRALTDPSADNFKPYRDPSYDGVGILGRYKNINNPHGNSPVAEPNSEFVNAFTQYPDAEELNRDNTLNEVEEYFQYEVDIDHDMQVGTNFITDKRLVTVNPPDGSTRQETWYLFRIPVSQYQLKVGNIPDFKSIRFVRMFVTGFEDSVVMRFGKLELVRNQWRKFKYEIDSTGNYVGLPANDPTTVNTLAVNIEENDTREPIPYVIPPGIERQQQLSNNNVQIYQNEQSLSVQIKNLGYQQARGVFKTFNQDMRQYGKLRMFIHAESIANCGSVVDDNELTGVIRIGNDFAGNYYEVRIPLKITLPGERDSLKIWPEANNLDFDLDDLTDLKSRRNRAGIPPSQYYSEASGSSGRRIAIVGNPNLGEVRGMLLAVENSVEKPICTEVWFNELRYSNLDENGGWAAIARVDIRLADLGTLSIAGAAKSQGFGTMEQKVNDRSREDVQTFDLAANIDAGKLLPKDLGIQIPVFAGFSKTQRSPEYDPYDLDIKLKDKLRDADPAKQDSIRSDAQDVVTIKTLNFTNVRKVKTDGKRPKIWSITNFDFNYSFIETKQHNPLIENDLMRRSRGAIGYNYAPQPKFLEPFKNMIKSKSKWLALIKDFNFNYAPSQLTFRADVFRQFGAIRRRNVGGGPYKIPETYDKYFTFDRYYIMQWNITRSIAIDFAATNYARIDEPYGRIDTKEKKDSVRKNFFKGGRNTQYQQDVTFTYTLPTQKIPLLDWTVMRASYNAKYNWLAASLLARELGNELANTQTRSINGELKFEELYAKSKFLRAVYSTAPPKPPTQQAPNVKDTTGKKKPKRIKDPNQLPEVGTIPKIFVKLLTSLKRVGIQYTEDFGTMLPGYMDSTHILGYNPKSGEPGFGFIFGQQLDTSGINSFGARGLFSHSELVSKMIQQRYNQRMNITAQISPLRDFMIDVNVDKNYDKGYSELYKDTLGTGSGGVGLTRLNPYALGSFSVSYISYNTLFQKFDPNVVSETFKQFENYRSQLSGKLAGMNPYGAAPDPNDPGYYEGYGRYAQDVVIPAFLAAYTGKSPDDVGFIRNDNPNLSANPFKNIVPKPNWAVTYTGLSRLKGLDKIFTSFTIRHGYHSTLSMNSFNTALLFQDPFRTGFPYFKDPLTGNYIPYFLVPNITISESFDPLIEFDMMFTNQVQARFEYRKSRQLSLSLLDYQLAENRSEEVTFGFNWRKKGMPLIKRLGKMKLDNDVTFRLDFSLRDDATSNSKLDQGTAFGTAGQKVIRIAPSIDYIVNNRVSMKLYFEQNRNIPKISNSFPITNTRAGLQVRISLAQ